MKELKLTVDCCLHCGRVFVLDGDYTSDRCPVCGEELYPVGRKLVPNTEIKCGDGIEVRIVGYDKDH